jgi:hypothetical protein
MRPAADYAAQSDPDRNWNFSRAWEDPPPRRNAPVDGQGASGTLANGVDDPEHTTSGEQAQAFRRAAEALFRRPADMGVER